MHGGSSHPLRFSRPTAVDGSFTFYRRGSGPFANLNIDDARHTEMRSQVMELTPANDIPPDVRPSAAQHKIDLLGNVLGMIADALESLERKHRIDGDSQIGLALHD